MRKRSRENRTLRRLRLNALHNAGYNGFQQVVHKADVAVICQNEVVRSELMTPDEVKHPTLDHGPQGLDSVPCEGPPPWLVGMQKPDSGRSATCGKKSSQPAGSYGKGHVEKCIYRVNRMAGAFSHSLW